MNGFSGISTNSALIGYVIRNSDIVCMVGFYTKCRRMSTHHFVYNPRLAGAIPFRRDKALTA